CPRHHRRPKPRDCTDETVARQSWYQPIIKQKTHQAITLDGLGKSDERIIYPILPAVTAHQSCPSFWQVWR
ncbi:hypothetical protein, partial [Moraxella catarrhalis]|uniref:hypothetical protein n=1 Tax=Moraxella catarrhalis TaxID=480 RepID=UPI001D0D9780